MSFPSVNNDGYFFKLSEQNYFPVNDTMNTIQKTGWLILGVALSLTRNLCLLIETYLLPILASLFIGLILGWSLRTKRLSLRVFSAGIIIGWLIFSAPYHLLPEDWIETSVFALSAGAAYVQRSRTTKVWSSVTILLSAFVLTFYFRFNEVNYPGTLEVVSPTSMHFLDRGRKEFPLDNKRIKVIALWYVKCKPCLEHLVEFQRLSSEFSNNPNVEFITCNVANDPPNMIREKLAKLSIQLPVALDSTGYLQSFKQSRFYPSTIILSKENKVMAESVGFLPEFEWMNQLWLKHIIQNEIEKSALTQNEGGLE